MKIDKKLIEKGIDECLIHLLHSKTKLSHRSIESADLYKDTAGDFIIKLVLEKGEFRCTRHTTLNINKSRIREMKLKLIFG